MLHTYNLQKIEVKLQASMFLQQNLFSIYRLIIKTPKIVFIAALMLAIFIAVSQVIFIFKINKTVDLSEPLLTYMILKNQQRQEMNAKPSPNATASSNKTNQENETVNNDFSLIDDSTLLHFRFKKTDKFEITLNYTYNHSKQGNPLMLLIKNQHLSYLPYLKNLTQDYLHRHQIKYDLITIPILQIQKPMLTFYYKQDMQKNEIMMESLRESFFELERKFNAYCLQKNITNGEFEINELVLNFYYESNNDINWFSLNFFQFLNFKVLPSFFLKFVFIFGSIFLIVTSNVFIGLVIRYIIISTFTLFLTVYDKCMMENGGWMHQYLAILYQRFQQNRLGAIKMAIFFILSNIGTSLLLAFGAYCILTKLIMPSLPLLIDDYASFFMKTIFFIEIFHFIFSRSRTTTKFFPLVSFLTNFGILTICSLKSSPTMMILLNVNMSIQLIYFIFFCLLEKIIVEQNEKGFLGDYCPSYSKPRMLFYAGYDISWQKSLPPIWTYFTAWFDFSYFNESERSLLQRDYQLLYGRMLGFNDRQQIPLEDEEMREESVPLADQPSNQMNLIHP